MTTSRTFQNGGSEPPLPSAPISYADSTKLSVAQAQAAGQAGTPIKFGTQTPRHIIQAYQAARQGLPAPGSMPSSPFVGPYPVKSAPTTLSDEYARRVAAQIAARRSMLPGALLDTLPGSGSPDDFRFTEQQLRDMLARGRAGSRDAESTEVRPNGEPEKGMQTSSDAERKAREGDAGASFERDAGAVPVPGAAPDKGLTPWLVAALLAYFTLGA